MKIFLKTQQSPTPSPRPPSPSPVPSSSSSEIPAKVKNKNSNKTYISCVKNNEKLTSLSEPTDTVENTETTPRRKFS